MRPEKLRLQKPGVAPVAGPALAVTVEERVYQGVSTTWVVRSARGFFALVWKRKVTPWIPIT